MNARRLAVTETNMAYRTADHLRWQSLDFVTGIEVRLSNNHNCKGYRKGTFSDICDDLQGRYPKDFKFTGWHPHCRCVAVPILKTPEEVAEDNKRIMQGKEPLPASASPQAVTKLPKVFTDWTKLNADRIESARAKGKLPYFLKDNERLTQPSARPTIAERARARHTQRSEAEAEAIRQAWAQRVKRNNAIKLNAEGIAKLAADFGEAPSLTALREAIASGDLTAMQAETRNVGRALAMIRKQEAALGDIIPDAHKWHKRFTMAELQNAHKAIKRKLSMIWGSLDDEAQVMKMQKALSFEVQWMETKGRKHKTWEVAREAYKRKLAVVDHRVEMFKIRSAIKDDIATLKASTGKAAKYLLADFDKLFADPSTDLGALREKAGEIIKKSRALDKAAKTRAAKAAKATGGKTGGKATEFTPKSDVETRDDFVRWAQSKGINIRPGSVIVDDGFVHLQGHQHEDIYNALKPETASEHRQLWNHHGARTRWGASGYIRTGNSFEINSDFRETGVTGPIDAAAEKLLRAHGALPDDIKTIKLLDKKIAEFSLPVPLRLTRYVQPNALPAIFGDKSIVGADRNALKLAIDKSAKNIVRDPAFLSASTNEQKNVFTGYGVKMEIEVPPDTPMYFSNNYDESEVVLARGTKMKLVSYGTYGYRLLLRLRVEK